MKISYSCDNCYCQYIKRDDIFGCKKCAKEICINCEFHDKICKNCGKNRIDNIFKELN